MRTSRTRNMAALQCGGRQRGIDPVIEETLDPRPEPVQFANRIAARALSAGDTTDHAGWLRGWHDREGIWTNLRNIEHWIDRAQV